MLLRKSEVQGPARGPEREETRSCEKATDEDSGRKTTEEMTVETTIIEATGKPTAGVVAECESVRAATSIFAGSEPERGEGIGPAGASPMAPDQGERPEHAAEEQRDTLME
jgi:hypothetical protein